MTDPAPLTDEEIARTEKTLEKWFEGDAHVLWLVRRLVASLRASRAENKELREALDQAQLHSIEARNPGIDMEEVKRIRRGG